MCKASTTFYFLNFQFFLTFSGKIFCGTKNLGSGIERERSEKAKNLPPSPSSLLNRKEKKTLVCFYGILFLSLLAHLSTYSDSGHYRHKSGPDLGPRLAWEGVFNPPPPTWHFMCGNAKMGRCVNSPDLTGTAAATDINGQPLLLSKIDSLACYCFCWVK